MNQSQTTAAYEAVYNTLKKRILHLDLLPGDMVSEIETSKEFSVSRTPIRDAFKTLANEGLLEVKPHIGTFVTLIDMNQIADILYIREVMEKAIANELSISFNQSQEFKVQHILNRQRQLLQDTTLSSQEFAMKFAESDNEFHGILFSLVGKERLLSHFHPINGQYQRFRTLLNLKDQSATQSLYDEHTQLLHHIKQKNTHELNDLLTHHIYDGFNTHTYLIDEYPHYFKALS